MVSHYFLSRPQHHPDPASDFLPAAPGHLSRPALHRRGSTAEHRSLPEPSGPDLTRHPGTEPGSGAALHLPRSSPHREQRFHLIPFSYHPGRKAQAWGEPASTDPPGSFTLSVLHQPELSPLQVGTFSTQDGSSIIWSRPLALRDQYSSARGEKLLTKMKRTINTPKGRNLIYPFPYFGQLHTSFCQNLPPPIGIPSSGLWALLANPPPFPNSFSFFFPFCFYGPPSLRLTNPTSFSGRAWKLGKKWCMP